MKRLLLAFHVSLLLAGMAQAQDAGSISPVAPLRNTPPGVDPELGVRRGHAIIVPLDDLPPGARAMAMRSLEDDRRGYATVSDASLSDAQHVDRDVLAPGDARVPDSALRIVPARTGLARMTFLGTRPDMFQDGRLVMATRVFRRSDGTLVFVREWQFAQTGGAIQNVRELLNTRVGEHLARLEIEHAPGGLRRSSLSWNDGRTAYTLEVYEDVDSARAIAAGHGRDWLHQLAESLGT